MYVHGPVLQNILIAVVSGISQGVLLSTRTLTVEHNYRKAPRNKRFLINYKCNLFYLYLKNREMNVTSP